MIHRFESFELDEDCFELRENGAVIQVTRKVFDLVLYLLRERDRVVSTDDLLDVLWAGENVIPGVVSQVIASARRVVRDDAAQPRIIATIRGRGYRFIARVEQGVEDEALIARPFVDDLYVGDRASVAVLPLSSFSADPDHEHLADGMTEDIIALLSRTPGILVIARTSTFAYKGRSRDVREIGRELGARYVVEGSLRRVRDHLRVTVQLIETDTGTHVWAQRYDREIEGIFTLEDEVTSAIIAHLQPQLARAEGSRARRTPPHDLNAWLLYHDAFSAHLYHQADPVANEQALKLIDRCLHLDPEFGSAFALRAALRANAISLGWAQDREAQIRSIRADARRALALAPDDPRVLGQCGGVAMVIDSHDDAIALLHRSLKIDPCNPRTLAGLGFCLAQTGSPEDGLAHLERALRVSPCDPTAHVWHLYIAVIRAKTEHWADALEEIDQSLASMRNMDLSWAIRAGCLAKLDRPDEARAAIAELHEINSAFDLEWFERALVKWNLDPQIEQDLLEHLRAVGLS